MGSQHTDLAKKEQVLGEVKNGGRVVESAARHGLNTKTICAWLRAKAGNAGTSYLRYSIRSLYVTRA